MAQRIAFAAIPNTQPIAYPSTLVLLFGEVRRSSPTPKSLREFLRLRNLFDKETFPVLTEILDLRLGDTATLGPFAARVLDADDEATIREALAGRLVEQNALMAKYCLEALDAERGGRLHSTNELYRMITSYVYPGDKPTLNAFKAWIDWAVAANLLKLVGIRWALGEKGKQWLPRLRAIDAEEFLEEERESTAAAAEPEEEAPEVEAPRPPVRGPAPGAGVASGEAPSQGAPESAVAGPGEAGGSPGPVPVPEVTPAERPGSSALPEPAPRAPANAPGATLPAVRPVLSPVDRVLPAGAAPGPEQLAATREALASWFTGFPGRRPLSCQEAGVDPVRRTPTALYEASFAALLVARGLPPGATAAALDSLKATGVLLAAGKGKLPVDSVSAALAKAPSPALAAACESVIHLPRLLAGTADPDLLRTETPTGLLWSLWRRLYEPFFPLAPFVLARFLGEARTIPDRLVPAGLVPTFAARENAFRIGFLDRLYAGTFADLVEASQALAAGFGAPDFEGPLAQAPEGFGCAFRCARVATCPLACREKGEMAPAGRA